MADVARPGIILHPGLTGRKRGRGVTYDVFLLVAILLMAGAVILLSPVPQRGALAFTVMACLAMSTAITGGMHWWTRGELSLPDTLHEWLGHIATALVTAAVLELFFHTRTLHHLDEQWRSTLTAVLQAEPVGLIALLRQRGDRGILVEAAIKAATGTERGDLIYRHLINPYLREDLRFRHEFVNRVEARSFRNSDLALWTDVLGNDGTDKYYLVHQQIEYRCDHSLTNASNEIEIRLVFELPELERSFRNPNVFFRELLQVDDACRDILKNLAPEKLQDTVLHVFRFAAYDDAKRNRPLTCTAGMHTEENYAQSYIKIIAKTADGSSLNTCRIEFTLPQVKENPYFLVQLNEPTYEPTIEFSHQDADVELSDFPFFPAAYERTQAPMEGRTRRIEIKLPNQWVFPRSGVLFTWRHRATAAEVGPQHP